MGADQIRAEGKEELFETASVLEALAQEGDPLFGDVHAATAAALGERKNPGGVFVATSTSGTVLANAGFFDEGQGTFKRGPEGGEVSQEVLLELRTKVGFDVHEICISCHIHTDQEKK